MASPGFLRDGDDIGWYRYGPRPGERGSAVLIGHRDTSAEGPGALFDVDLLERGDQVIVKTLRESVTFVVTSSAYYDKQALPATLFGRQGPAGSPSSPVVGFSTLRAADTNRTTSSLLHPW